MPYKILTRVAGLAVVMLLIGGWGLSAHAQVCTSANCLMQWDRSNDPAYQAALYGGWPNQYQSGYYPYSYNYHSYGMYPYSSYPYNSYQSYPYSSNQDYHYQYQYQYQYQYSNQNQYSNQSQYSNQYFKPYPYQQQTRNSYWQDGCLITTIQVNGVIQTTRACG